MDIFDAVLEEIHQKDASPYRTGMRSDNRKREYTDEHWMLERWRPVVEWRGGVILGVDKLPPPHTRLHLDGMDWVISLMDAHDGREYSVPFDVFGRITALEADGVPFTWWIWGKEEFSRPRFIAQPDLEPQMRPQVRPQVWPQVERPVQKRDPLVIGVIPTGNRRGIWVLLGKWFD